MKDVQKPDYAFIDGQKYYSQGKETFCVTSPINRQEITTLPALNESDIDVAVASAKKAFDDGVWRNKTKQEKKQILLKFADLISENAQELATLESMDMGMPLNLCQNQNIQGCVGSIRWYAESIDKIYDETCSDNGKLNIITREPVGVVGIITPWNFPCMIVGWKIAPALIAGNSVVLKPAEDASMATIKIAELAIQAGLPKGVLNIVTGLGTITGQALAKHNDVRVIAFTGSGGVGGQLLQYAGQSNLKRVYLELGGKNANIVLPDVPNIDVAIKNSTMGIFANSGQICASPSRLLVHKDIYDEFVDGVVKIASNIKIGDPFDDKNNLGPVANENQFNKILSYIEKGKSEGAECVLGGKPADLDGYFIKPTVFKNVTPDMTIAREEIFGPVLSIIKFDNDEQAVEFANDTEYGLTAGIWTSDISKAHSIADKLETGTVFVNHFGGAEITVPFGGWKQSGNGADKSLHAVEKYTQLKTTIIKL